MNINKDKKVESIKVKKNRKISELLSLMENTGFQGKNLAKTVSVFENMVRNPDVTILFGYAAPLSTTGQWKIINWLLDNNYIDILVPTGANISEDIVEAMGGSYLQYSQNSNDSDLFEKGFNRYYDILGDESEHLEMTELIAEFILTLDGDYIYSSREFLKYFGDWLLTKNIDSPKSKIVHTHNVQSYSSIMMKMGEAAYKQNPQNETGEQQDNVDNKKKDEDESVVDADFEEVDNDQDQDVKKA